MMLVSMLSFGQYQLEKSYVDLAIYDPMRRANFEYTGEKYYFFEPIPKVVSIYNADHTLYRSVQLPFSANRIERLEVTETFFNDSAGLEISGSIGHIPTNGVSTHSVVLSEAGEILYAVPNGTDMVVSRFPGLADKVIVTMVDKTCRVYNKRMVLEHTFDAPVTRIVLPNAGEKYYNFNPETRSFKFFNSDFTLWKSFAIPQIGGSLNDYSVTLITDDLGPDAQLVIGFYYGVEHGVIVNENGDVIIESIGKFTVSRLEGLPNKLIAKGIARASDVSGMNALFSTTIFNLPGLQEIAHFDFYVNRVKLEISGEKYYEIARTENVARIYNSDFSLWRSITLPPSTDTFGISDISETKINADPLIEITYLNSTGGRNQLPRYWSKVVNENQEVIVSAQSASGLEFSQLPGLENKFIGFMNRESQSHYAAVYGLAALQTVDFSKNKAVVYPNPTAGILNVKTAGKQIVYAGLYNILGERVKSEKASNIEKINTENLQAGTYLLKLTADDGSVSSHKVIVVK